MSDALRRFQAHPEMSRAEERAAVEARTFATLDAPQRTAARFPDPQAPPSSDEATLVAPGLARASVLVEPMVYETMERVRRPITAAAATPPPPDPAEIARQVVAEARATARTMLAQARDVIASERAQAVQAGYDEGYAKGVADADTEMSGLVATCEQIGVQVMAERERALADYEPDVVELAIAISRRIVNAAIDVDETLVVQACRGAMRKAFQRGALQVLAHPADLELLRTAGPELARELGGVEHLDFVEERRLDRGSVVVRTPAGEIDGTIAGKSDKIEDALREGIEQRIAIRRAS